MVEGGARVINSFLQANLSTTPLVDSLIVTVAPTFVGSTGVAYETTTDSEGVKKCNPISPNLNFTFTLNFFPLRCNTYTICAMLIPK